MKKNIVVSTVFLAILGVVGACSSVPTKTPDGTPIYGIPKIIAKSDGQTPQWVDNYAKFAKSHPDRHYFVGVASHVSEEDIGRDEAMASAMAMAASSIKNTVNNLMIRAIVDDKNSSYSNELQKDVQDGTLQIAKAKIHGGTVDKYYWVQKYVQTGPGETVVYRNYYALMSLSNQDYDKTIQDSLTKEYKSVDVPKAKKLVGDMKHLFLKEKVQAQANASTP